MPSDIQSEVARLRASRPIPAKRRKQMQEFEDQGGKKSSKQASSIEDRSLGNQKIAEASALSAGIKLSGGQIEEITLNDLEEIVSVLSAEKAGFVKFRVFIEFFQKCLHCTDVEIDVMRKQLGVRHGDDMVTAAELHHTLRVASIRLLLLHAHREQQHRQDVRHSSSNAPAPIERGFMADRVKWRVRRDEAFGTLPTTFIYLIIFMLLIVYHLQIWRRQELERGIETWIQNTAETLKGPFITEHVYSADTFNFWLQTSGLLAIFGGVSENSAGEVEIMMASNTVFGDAQLTQRRGQDYEERSAWLLGSPQAVSYLASHAAASDRFVGAASAALNYFLNASNRWLDEETYDLSLTFYTYNNPAEIYAKTAMFVRLDLYGYVKPRVKTNAVLVDPYPLKWLFIVDGIYAFMLLYLVMAEWHGLRGAIRFGLYGLHRYLTFWKVVDLTNILLGFANLAIWSACCWSMQESSFVELLDGDKHMRKDVIGLRGASMDQLHRDLEEIYSRFFILHLSAALTAVCIVCKFFKGFEANPRLQTVSKTLQFVAPDLVHFAVVLLPIYVAFAVIGHVLFGIDIRGFKTIGTSFNTAVQTIMGEFDWYERLSDTPLELSSGMPRWVLAVWFISYFCFCALVMLNMILAIITSQYSQVSDALINRADARTIWQQSWRYLRRQLDQRVNARFIPLSQISHGLHHRHQPAHPDTMVATESLQEAFDGMKPEQAEWIMNFLRAELQEHVSETVPDEMKASDARMEKMVHSIVEECHVVGDAVAACTRRIDRLESTIKQKRRLQAEIAAGETQEQPQQAAAGPARNTKLVSTKDSATQCFILSM